MGSYIFCSVGFLIFVILVVEIGLSWIRHDSVREKLRRLDARFFRLEQDFTAFKHEYYAGKRKDRESKETLKVTPPETAAFVETPKTS